MDEKWIKRGIYMEFEIGKTYEFKAHSRFKHPLQGIVQKVYDNSILVKIIVVHRKTKKI